jgi:hypothetical protein
MELVEKFGSMLPTLRSVALLLIASDNFNKKDKAQLLKLVKVCHHFLVFPEIPDRRFGPDGSVSATSPPIPPSATLNINNTPPAALPVNIPEKEVTWEEKSDDVNQTLREIGADPKYYLPEKDPVVAPQSWGEIADLEFGVPSQVSAKEEIKDEEEVPLKPKRVKEHKPKKEKVDKTDSKPKFPVSGRPATKIEITSPAQVKPEKPTPMEAPVAEPKPVAAMRSSLLNQTPTEFSVDDLINDARKPFKEEGPTVQFRPVAPPVREESIEVDGRKPPRHSTRSNSGSNKNTSVQYQAKSSAKMSSSSVPGPY